MIITYLSKHTACDLSRLGDLPYDDLEGLRNKLQESKSLFYEYYFIEENKEDGVRKYTPSEVKNITNTIRTLYRDTPFARLENG